MRLRPLHQLKIMTSYGSQPDFNKAILWKCVIAWSAKIVPVLDLDTSSPQVLLYTVQETQRLNMRILTEYFFSMNILKGPSGQKIYNRSKFKPLNDRLPHNAGPFSDRSSDQAVLWKVSSLE
jgi:hypothetical protein